MKQYQLFQTDYGAPPPPPPSMSSQLPNSGGMNTAPSASTNAIIALVAGILSWIGCGLIAGIVAWVMGKGELAKIDRGESPEAGRSFAKIGMWLGIVNVIFSIIAGILVLIYFVFIAAMVGTSH